MLMQSPQRGRTSECAENEQVKYTTRNDVHTYAAAMSAQRRPEANQYHVLTIQKGEGIPHGRERVRSTSS